MIFVVSLYEILHDRARFEQTNLLSVGERVGQRRDPSVWIDLQEPWLLLSVLADVYLVDVVLQSERR